MSIHVSKTEIQVCYGVEPLRKQSWYLKYIVYIYWTSFKQNYLTFDQKHFFGSLQVHFYRFLHVISLPLKYKELQTRRLDSFSNLQIFYIKTRFLTKKGTSTTHSIASCCAVQVTIIALTEAYTTILNIHERLCIAMAICVTQNHSTKSELLYQIPV